MKILGTGIAVVIGATVAMTAGAYLVMNKPCVRKIYRKGRRYAKKMLNM